MDDTVYMAQQDAMRPLRMFPGALTGPASVGVDQSFATQDATAGNNPYAYAGVGQAGAAVGAPISMPATAGVTLSPLTVVMVLAVAYMLWKK